MAYRLLKKLGLLCLLSLLASACEMSKRDETFSDPKKEAPKGDLSTLKLSLRAVGARYITNQEKIRLEFSANQTPDALKFSTNLNCDDGVWVPYELTKEVMLLPNLVNPFRAQLRKANLISNCDEVLITQDSIPPLISISEPAPGSKTSTSLTISGVCENGLQVGIGGNDATSNVVVPCQGSAYTATLSLTPGDGPKNLIVAQQDAAQNLSTLDLLVALDSLAPLSPTLTINEGTLFTRFENVTLSLGAVDASEFYATQSVTCNDGGTWRPMAQTSNFVLTNLNAVNTVHVKYRDDVKNESNCVTATITHDTLAPVAAIVVPAAGSTLLTANLASVTISGTCSDPGRDIVFSGPFSKTVSCAVNGSFSFVQSFSTIADGNLIIHVDYIDAAGNAMPTLSHSIIKDTVAPLVQITNPLEGAKVPLQKVVQGTCETGTALTFTGTGLQNSNLAPCVNSSFSANLSFATGEGTKTFSATQSDIAGNQTTVTRSVVLDTLPPQNTSIVINGGSLTSSSPDVTLTLAATDVADMYITATPNCASGSSWEPFAPSKPWTLPVLNGANIVFAKFRDEVGNASNCISASIEHTGPPTLTLVSPANNSFVNAANVGALSVTGTCSVIGQNVVLSGALSVNASCVSPGSFNLTLNMSSLAEGTATFTLNHGDGLGNAAPAVSLTLVKDTIPASVAITSPVAGTVVNSTNQASFVVSGSCSENGRAVDVVSPVSASTTCNANTWSLSLNLTSLAEGAFNVDVSHNDAALNGSAAHTRSMLKDSNAIVATSIQLEGGAAFVSNPIVSASFVVSPLPIEMYLTENATCSTGGTWVSYANPTSLTLSAGDATKTVYAKFKSSSGSQSNCVNASIIFDTTAPTWASAPTHAAAFNSLIGPPPITYIGNAVDAGSGIQKYQYAIGTGIAGASINNLKDWTDATTSPITGVSGLTLTEGSTYFVSMRAIDKLGFTTTLSSSGWSVDVTAPSFTLQNPNENFYSGDYDVTIDGTCEVGIPVSFSFMTGLGGAGSAECLAGQYRAALVVDRSQGSGVRTFTAEQTDLAGNQSSVTRSFNFYRRFEPIGPVNAQVTLSDGSRVIGGDFASVSQTRVGGIIAVSGTGAIDALDFHRGFNGTVHVIISDNAGGWYVGGAFTQYRGLAAHYVAHILADASLDLSFNPQFSNQGVNAEVRALALSGSGLYLGGDFTHYRGTSAPYIAKLSVADFSLDMTFNPASGGNGFNNIVRAIVVDGTSLYAGGDFTQYRGASANRIAKLSNTGVLNTVFNPSNSNGFSGAVYSMALFGTDIIVGGSFNFYKVTAVNNIARISTAGTLNTTFSPATNGTNGLVSAVAVNASTIYLGGTFTSYRGTTVNRITKVDSNGVLDSGFNSLGLGANTGAVNALGLFGSSLYVGGSFTSLFGQRALSVAKVDTLSGEMDVLFSPATGANGANYSVLTIAAGPSSSVVLGGSFTTYRPEYQVNNIAKIFPNGSLDLTFLSNALTPGFSGGIVNALQLDAAENIYVGGSFTSYRGVSYNRIIKLNSAGSVDTSFYPTSASGGFNSSNSVVHALAIDDSFVYVGGSFLRYRGGLQNNITRLNLVNGASDSSFNPTNGNSSNIGVSGGWVYGLALAGNPTTHVFVGGSFTQWKGNAAGNRLLKVATSGASVGQLEPTFIANNWSANAIVKALALSNSGLLVGGSFNSFRSQIANNVMLLDQTTGDLNTSFSPQAGANGTEVAAGVEVNTLYVNASSVYLGGTFTQYRGSSARRIARLALPSGTLDSTFSAGPLNGANGGVYTITQSAGRLLIGGSFSLLRGSGAPFSSRIDPLSGLLTD